MKGGIMKTRTFSPEQQAYLVAKAVYEELLEQIGPLLNELHDACGDLETDEEIEAYVEREAQIRREYNLLQAELRLREAEQDLLKWGIAAARQLGIRGEDMQALEALATTPLVRFRARAIDLVMRLDAATVPEKRGGRA
jgi:DNA-binding HxlR family transcriptional regulator